MRVDFYLLERGGAEGALIPLGARVLESGARLLVVAEEAEERARLSDALWGARPDSFLANGLAGTEHDARQPILISGAVAPANGARILALADGLWREGAEREFDRILLIFNETGRLAARETWRRVKALPEAECHFWKQEGRSWKQAG